MQTDTLTAAPMLWVRRAPALGIAAAVLFATSFVFAANGPGSTDDDAKITSWYESSSHIHTQMAGFIAFVVGALCLLGFFSALRERIDAAERAPGSLGGLAFGAGVASTVLTTLAMGFFALQAFLVFDTSSADVVPTTYRMFYTAAYVSWVAGAMIGGLTVAASSAVAFRTGFLPRWFAWAGVVVAVLQLLAAFFVPEFALWAWILVAGVLLLRRSPGEPSRAR